MHDFEHVPARDRDEVLRELSGGAVAIAGGTELLNWVRLGIAGPDRLVDLAGLAAGDRIERTADGLTIGAGATLNQVGEHDLVRTHATALAQACLAAASAQVRNRATLGGNVLQKTRCGYFRSEEPLPWGCNKRRPGSGCAARHGLNERHAVLGWTDDCVATQPSDPAVALACLDARVEVLGPAGPRTLPMTGFHLTQQEAAAAGGDPAGTETVLRADELIVAYHLPVRPAERSTYLKVRERASYEYALVSAAAATVLDGGRLAGVRLALGSVAQKPWRLSRAEAALRGGPLTEQAARRAVALDLADARPLEHNGYKLRMAATAAVRALMATGEQA